MGYLFLIIALMGGCAKSYCGKRISGTMEENTDALIINLTRMVLCSAIGFIIALVSAGSVDIFRVNGITLLLALISGIFSAVFVISWLFSVKSGAYTMVEIFIMSGTLIPMLGSALIFKEEIKTIQWLGFVIIAAGVALLRSYNNSVKEKLSFRSLLVLLATGISNGVTELTQKLFSGFCRNESNAVFNFYTYIFAALIILSVLSLKKADITYVRDKIKSVVIYVLVMAAGLFVNSFFKVQAAYYIDAAKLYPLNQGAALALGAIMAAVFFGEKIRIKSIIGLLLGFIGICIINFA